MPTTETTGGSVIRLRAVHKRFGDKHVLRGIDLDVPRGVTTVVLGPSGCGKSVMLKHMLGLLRPDSGEVWYERTRVDQLGEAELNPVRRRFGFLFQHGALFDSMTVGENVAFPLTEHSRLTAEDQRARAMEVLELVGLTDRFDSMPVDLSGGQQKRVALARAIVLKPEVVLYDEPTTGLDPIRAEIINDLIVKLKAQFSITGVVVTHDLASASRVADQMVMLHEGRVELAGEPALFRRSSNAIVRTFLDANSERIA